MSKKSIIIAVPASIISDTPHLREKTAKIGLIGRAAAIFRIDEIIIYPDNPKTDQTQELSLISTLLSYMETPQYMRKELFKIHPNLQYVGILPPLRTPHHPADGNIKNLRTGEFREGFILKKTKEGLLLDIGLKEPAIMFDKQFATQKRVPVRITKIDRQIEVEIADLDQIPQYWGYKVTVEKKSLTNLLQNRQFNLTIGTSKFGTDLTKISHQLEEKWKGATIILIVFGAPTRGLQQIAKEEGKKLNCIMDFVLNTIPNQGTETVRTEEAVLASLAILNVNLQP
jgi:predicted SPOUT superfamily RNA methylase MTH1